MPWTYQLFHAWPQSMLQTKCFLRLIKMEGVEHNIVKWKLEFTVLLGGPYNENYCLHNASYQPTNTSIKAVLREMSFIKKGIISCLVESNSCSNSLICHCFGLCIYKPVISLSLFYFLYNHISSCKDNCWVIWSREQWLNSNMGESHQYTKVQRQFKGKCVKQKRASLLTITFSKEPDHVD